MRPVSSRRLRYAALRQANERKAVLGGAADVNTLNKALTDLTAALRAKEALAASDDVGRDLSSVQALKKKHNDVLRDVATLAEKAKVLDSDVEKTAQANPKMAPGLLQKQSEMNQALVHVQDLVAARAKKLEDAESIARFDLQVAEVTSWLKERSVEVDAGEQPKDAATAQALLKKHDALKARGRAPCRHAAAAVSPRWQSLTMSHSRSCFFFFFFSPRGRRLWTCTTIAFAQSTPKAKR